MIEADDFLAGLKKGDRCAELIVPISGGKDSQACLKMAVRDGYRGRVICLFCDTGFEHPWTYQHLGKISELYGVPVVRVSEGTVESEVVRNGRFPTKGARFCTDKLKIVASKKFYAQLWEVTGVEFQVWLGVRESEGAARGKKYGGIEDWETFRLDDLFPGAYPKWLSDVGCRFRLPVVDWEREDIMLFLEGEENPLYRWFGRVGCFPCLAAGDGTKLSAFQFDDFGARQWALVQELAEIVDDSVFVGEAGGRWGRGEGGCGICSL